MNKLLIGLPVVAALVFGGVPFMTGIVAEKKSKEIINNMNTQASEFGEIKATKYDRGFFSSQSSYVYSLNPSFQALFKVESIEYNCELDHGVAGVGFACLMANKGEYKTFLDEFLGGKDPLSVTGNISAFGGIDYTVAIDPLNMDLADGTNVSVPEKAFLKTEFDQNLSVYDFTGKIPKVLIDKGALFDLDNISLDGSVKELRDGLYVGDVTMKGSKMTVGDEKGTATFNDFNVDTSTKESSNNISTSMTVNAKSVEFPNQAGEMDAFSDVMVDVGMFGMDTDALAEYVKVTDEQQKAFLNAGSDTEKLAEISSSMETLVPVLEKLLKKGLGMNATSSFEVDGTTNNFSMDLNLLNEMKFSEMMGFLFAPDETLKNFKGNLNVDLKKELIEKYPVITLALGGIPFFVQTDAGTTLDVKLDSVLKVNGEETTMAELQSLFR